MNTLWMTSNKGEHLMTRNMALTAQEPKNQEPGAYPQDQDQGWRQRGHQDTSTSTRLCRAPGPSKPPARTKEPVAENQDPEQGLIAGAMTKEPLRMPQRQGPGSQEQEQETWLGTTFITTTLQIQK